MLILMFTCSQWLVQLFKRNQEPEEEALLVIDRESEQRWFCFNWFRNFFKRNETQALIDEYNGDPEAIAFTNLGSRWGCFSWLRNIFKVKVKEEDTRIQEEPEVRTIIVMNSMSDVLLVGKFRHEWRNSSILKYDNEIPHMILMSRAAYRDTLLDCNADELKQDRKTFYDVVKNKGNFFVIIETVEDYVFGAFTSTGFGEDRAKGIVNDPHSYLFSIRRAGDAQCHRFRPKNPAKAFSFDKDFGVSFGDNELVIKNNFEVSHAFLGDSYDKPEQCDQIDKRNFLAGSVWQVSRLEIIRVHLDLVGYLLKIEAIKERNAENRMEFRRNTYPYRP